MSIAITCAGEPDPLQGSLIYSHPPVGTGNYAYGTTVEYECDSGFGLNPGPTVRACNGNDSSILGFYDGTAPTCDSELWFMSHKTFTNATSLLTAITCSLSNPPNGNISFSAPPEMNGQYPIGTDASYFCNIGFSLMPSPTVRVCVGNSTSAFGDFDGNEPVCESEFIV